MTIGSYTPLIHHIGALWSHKGKQNYGFVSAISSLKNFLSCIKYSRTISNPPVGVCSSFVISEVPFWKLLLIFRMKNQSNGKFAVGVQNPVSPYFFSLPQLSCQVIIIPISHSVAIKELWFWDFERWSYLYLFEKIIFI